MFESHKVPGLALATLTLSAVLASCGQPQNAAVPGVQSGLAAAPATVPATVPATAPVNVSGLPVDPYLTSSPLQEQATEPYNITLKFAPGSSASVVSAMQSAATRWQRVIARGLPSYSANIPAGSCGSNAAYAGTIDDLLVFTGNTAIDGPGGILAQSGPCSIRSASGLTTYSTLVFDTADLSAFSSQLADIAVHELGHSLGIGTLWQQFGLVSGIGGTNPTYKGVSGLREYRAAGGTLSTVPVENQGGPGTAGGHWRETVFKTELMTGYLNSGVLNPLSRMSVGSLQDMGYTVNYGAADAYAIPSLNGQAVGELLDLGGREQLITPKYRSE
ncbi:leishmanolysin-related zinc metalloendopeptidase [Deinococcus arenicola]|uniref:Peptidase n=1 Tax=Deinococcus arenicola TaxID=2994950 RepID=A0ABU4DMZ7_9DEIO|nr:leishmanolysin-related zinc metalloendopeptidase [Deinococcus sp. ZS9-10]MDV6373806.1 hypothetical protein [Deinococcus sp. ZS9-10]